MGSLKRNCKTFGCRNLHTNRSGYCNACMERYALLHPKAESEDKRPSAAERGYDGKWQRFAKFFLMANQTCAICGAPATCVDHKDMPADVMLEVYGGTFDYDESHYQALCSRCNARKGKTDDRKMRERYEADKARLGISSEAKPPGVVPEKTGVR